MNHYTVKDGIIQNPGKFEGQPIYVPYFYEMLEDADNIRTKNGTTIYSFFILARDVIQCPMLNGATSIDIWETDDGFVHHELFYV